MATLLRVLRLLPALLLLVLASWPTSTTASASSAARSPAGPPVAALPEPLTEPVPEVNPVHEAPPVVVPARKLRRLLKKEVRPGVAREARHIIDTFSSEPFGTEIPFVVDGREYVARIEEHYHPPGGEARPWGKHAGVSVFVGWPVDGR